MEVNKLKIHCKHCRYKSFLFTKLSDKELNLLSENREEVYFDPGESLLTKVRT